MQIRDSTKVFLAAKLKQYARRTLCDDLFALHDYSYK